MGLPTAAACDCMPRFIQHIFKILEIRLTNDHMAYLYVVLTKNLPLRVREKLGHMLEKWQRVSGIVLWKEEKKEGGRGLKAGVGLHSPASRTPSEHARKATPPLLAKANSISAYNRDTDTAVVDPLA